MSVQNRGHRWLPGQSGNPGGRPRTARYAAAAREILASQGETAPSDWGSKETWTKAQALATSDYRAALTGDAKAADRILDRAEGRPASTIEFEGTLGVGRIPDGIEPEQVKAIARDPNNFLASHVKAEIQMLLNGSEMPDGKPALVTRVLADPESRAGLRILLGLAEVTEGAPLLPPASNTGTEEA